MSRIALRQLRDDSGIAMITAIMATMVVVSLSLVSFQLSHHNLDQTANERRSVQAIHAAEAGIDRFLEYLAYNAPIGAPACSLPVQSLSTSPPASFVATAAYYSNVNDPEHSTMSCPVTSAPAAVMIRSVGTSASRSRTMEAFVGLTANSGGYTLANSAVFANKTATWTGQATITNAVGTELAANLYSNADLELKGGGTIYGQVEAQGLVTLGGSTDVKSFVTAKSALSLSNNAMIRGSARSTTAGITNGGTINGSAYYCTGSAPGGTVGGSRIPECPNPPGPPVQSFQPFTYVASDWQSKGYDISHTYTGSTACAQAQTFVSALAAGPAANYVVRINNTCSFTVPNVTLKGSLAIISNGDIKGSGSTSIGVFGGSTPNPPYTLHLMANILNSPAAAGGLACPSNAGFSMSAGNNFPAGISLLIYSACDVSFTGNATAAFQGQIIAGGEVKFASGSNITYRPIKIPGTTANGFTESLHYRREVTNS